MRFLCVVLIILFCKCNCKYYPIHSSHKGSDEPIFVMGARRYSSPCIGAENIRIGVSEGEIVYAVKADSVALGNVATIMYVDRQPFESIVVGAGSEFEVGKCRFRVLKVYPPNYIDTIYDNFHLRSKIALQALSFPKRCRCENKALQRFDEEVMDSTWEQRYFDW